MWRRKAVSAIPLLLLFAVVLAADSPSEKQRVDKLTNNLVCTCGCAHLIVATCGCGQAAEMIREVDTFVKSGKTDAEIYQVFEKKYGPAVLGAPKMQGFNVLAWVLPFAGLGFGAVIVVVVVRRLHPKNQEPEAEPALPEIDEKYRQRIDEELED